MSDDKPELENAIRLAIEAADAANSSAADIAEMKRQYQDAADKIEASRKGFGILSMGIVASVVVVLGASSFVVYKSINEMKTAYNMQIEALGVFTQSVGELRTTLSSVETVIADTQAASAQLNAAMADQNAAAQLLTTQVTVLREEMGSQIAAITQEASALQPQMASAIQQQVTGELTTLNDDIRVMISDLQLAISKMIAMGFETMPTQQTASVAPRSTPTKAAPKSTKPRSAPKSRKQSAPKPNPFKFP